MYTDYVRKGQAAIIPLMTKTPVVLSASDTKFIVDAENSLLSSQLHLNDLLQVDYTIMDQDIAQRPACPHVIVTSLTKAIGNPMPEMLDETSRDLERLMNYDFKMETGRPEGSFIGTTPAPPLKKIIWVLGGRRAERLELPRGRSHTYQRLARRSDMSGWSELDKSHPVMS